MLLPPSCTKPRKMLEYIGTEKLKWDSMKQLFCFGHTFWAKTSQSYSSFAIHGPISTQWIHWFITRGPVEPLFYWAHGAPSRLISLLFICQGKCNKYVGFERRFQGWREVRASSGTRTPKLRQCLYQTSEWAYCYCFLSYQSLLGRSPHYQLGEAVFVALRCSLTCRPGMFEF